MHLLNLLLFLCFVLQTLFARQHNVVTQNQGKIDYEKQL